MTKTLDQQTVVKLNDGTAEAPAVDLGSNTGLYRETDGTMVAVVDGEKQLSWTTTQVLIEDGSATAPSLAFRGNPQYGLRLFDTGGAGTEYVAVHCGTTTPALEVYNGRIETSRVRAGDGSLAAPSYAFQNDTDTGLRLEGTADMRITVGGSDKVELTTSSVKTNTPLTISDGVVEETTLTAGSNGLDINNAITLPTTGGTKSPLDFYEVYTADITLEDFGSNGYFSDTVEFKFVRIGDMVCVSWPRIQGTVSTAFDFITSASGAVPSRFRPGGSGGAVLTAFGLRRINGDTATQTNFRFQILSDGTIRFACDGPVSTQWSGDIRVYESAFCYNT